MHVSVCVDVSHCQPDVFRLSSHPSQPVVAQNSQQENLQDQVPKEAQGTKNTLRILVNRKTNSDLHSRCPLPADGHKRADRGRMVVLHPGGQVEEAGQQQVDEGHHHRESQQAGLMQWKVRDGGALASLLKVLFGTGRKMFE